MSSIFDTLPLHCTQKKVEETSKYTVYCYHLIPSFDFHQKILSRGSSVTVLNPAWFHDEVKEEIDEMVKNYHS